MPKINEDDQTQPRTSPGLVGPAAQGAPTSPIHEAAQNGVRTFSDQATPGAAWSAFKGNLANQTQAPAGSTSGPITKALSVAQIAQRSFGTPTPSGPLANLATRSAAGTEASVTPQSIFRSVQNGVPSFSDQPSQGGKPYAVNVAPAPQQPAPNSLATMAARAFGSDADPSQNLARFVSPQAVAGGGEPTDMQRIQGWLAQTQQAHNEARARQAQDFAASTATENAISQRNQDTELARRARQAAGSLRLAPGGRTQRQLLDQAAGFDAAAVQAQGRIGTDKDFIRSPEQEAALAQGRFDSQTKRQDADARTLAATADAARALSGPRETFGNPVDELDANGKPIRVQYGDQGSRRTIDGAQPVPKANGGISIGPDGQLQVTGSLNGPKLTEQQSKDLGFYARGTEALKNLGAGDALTSYGSTLASHVPGFGNKLAGDDYQRAQQAGNEFIASILRKDSGAAITKQEQDTYGRMYLPQPGDSPETLKQKAGARQTALDAIKSGMGPAQQLVPQGGQQRARPQQGTTDYSHLWE